MTDQISERLGPLLEGPDDEVDLGRAALEVARLEYADLDVESYARRLDLLAASAGRGLPRCGEPAETIEAVNQFLFFDQGFRGNIEDYYNPRNSFLNDVVDRRTGIPITLSVVYLEIAGRLGLPFYGVGLPGHFVVKYDDGRQVIYVDVFGGGEVLDRQGCGELITSVLGRPMELGDLHFAAVEKRDIIRRMLNNLRSIYLNGRQYRKGMRVLDLMIGVFAEDGELYKERGLLQYQMRDFSSARKDFKTYLSLSPEAADADEVKKYITGLQALQAMMN